MTKELINSDVEIYEDFLPNSNLTYDVYFDGANRFIAELCQSNIDRRMVAVEEAPRVLVYELLKPMDSFDDGEKRQILEYKGLKLSDGFEPSDVFMEKSYIKLVEIDGVPYYENDMLTPELRRAFVHVKKHFPTLSMVVFDRDGRWQYMDSNFDGFDFKDLIDQSILEDASDSVPHLPFIYQESLVD